MEHIHSEVEAALRTFGVSYLDMIVLEWPLAVCGGSASDAR
jgi:hypothetical protein